MEVTNLIVNATSFEFDMSVDNFSTFVDGFNSTQIGPDTFLELRFLDPSNYQVRVRSVNDSGTSENSETLEINLITSVDDELTVKRDFKVFPNPVKETFSVSIPDKLRRNSKLILYDISGNKLIESDISTNQKEVIVDGNGLKAGIYLVTLTGNGISVQKRLIKI